ncbi:hypothetical protein HDV00_008286 [Rhizophlyctis rosea]|nr:hypothetical protein HDV00_008286 [Rhizophlyctis rosea]
MITEEQYIPDLPAEILASIAQYGDRCFESYDTARKLRISCKVLYKLIHEGDIRRCFLGTRAAWLWGSYFGHIRVLRKIFGDGKRMMFADGRLGMFSMALRLAATNKGAEVVRWALENGAAMGIMPDICEHDFLNSLRTAPDVQQLVEDVDPRMDPFLRAINNGHLETVKAFVEIGSALEGRDLEWGDRPLKRNGRDRSKSPDSNWSILDHLAANKRKSQRLWPIYRAIQLGHRDVCLYLLERLPWLTCGMLTMAVKVRQRDLVRALLQRQELQDISKRILKKAPVIAAVNHDLPMMTILTEAIGDEGFDAHDISSVREITSHAAGLLFPYVTDPAVFSLWLHFALRMREPSLAYAILFHCAAHGHSIRFDLDYILESAASSSNSLVLALLLNGGIRRPAPTTYNPSFDSSESATITQRLPWIRNWAREVPLLAAAGSSLCISLLLLHGADVNEGNGIALYEAVEQYQKEAVMTLLEAGAEPQAALFVAAVKCNMELTAVLLGAATDKDVHEVLNYAIRQNAAVAVHNLLGVIDYHNDRLERGPEAISFDINSITDKTFYGCHEVGMSYSRDYEAWPRTYSIGGNAAWPRTGAIVLPVLTMITLAAESNCPDIIQQFMNRFYPNSIVSVIRTKELLKQCTMPRRGIIWELFRKY